MEEHDEDGNGKLGFVEFLNILGIEVRKDLANKESEEEKKKVGPPIAQVELTNKTVATTTVATAQAAWAVRAPPTKGVKLQAAMLPAPFSPLLKSTATATTADAKDSKKRKADDEPPASAASTAVDLTSGAVVWLWGQRMYLRDQDQISRPKDQDLKTVTRLVLGH
mmetsp:Transcript_19602/g.35489  ORF Transcript_19602/g.35489 Transcript_19602/m.35489 type:complete len:166 (+) Transcript_19602:106-603(+)